MSRKRWHGKRLKRKDEEWLDRATQAVLVEGLASQEAEARSLELRVSIVRSGQTEFPHWQFRARGKREVLLHYWPAKGSWYDPCTGERGNYTSWEDALHHAEARAHAASVRG